MWGIRCVLVFVKLKDDKVRDYIVSYITSLAVHKAAVDLLPESFSFPRPVDRAQRSQSYQTLKSPTPYLNLHKFLSEKGDNSVLLVEAAEL